MYHRILARNDNVTLVSFAIFQVKDRADREGRKPKAGEIIHIKVSKLPSFK
jgi:DNA-binding protein HU-beta